MTLDTSTRLQQDIQNKIARLKSNFKKSPKDRLTISYIETYLENLEKQWLLFENTHNKIIIEVSNVEKSNDAYFKDGVYGAVECMYIDLKSEMKQMLTERIKPVDREIEPVDKGKSNSSSNVDTPQIKLPQVKIPIFSGKYTEWQTFRDLFVGLVHNNKDLDDAQKLYYLKGQLSGEAQQLLNNVSITANNYKCSWDKLQSMYNNKRFLANGNLNRLLNQKCISVESAVEIKRLICNTTDCLESINNLGIDTASWDIIIIHIISAKLDRETRRAWELHVASIPGDTLPKFTEFTEFLTGRFRGLESLDTKSYVTKGPKSFHVIEKAKKDTLCIYCLAPHKLTQCKKFTKESNDARRSFVQERGLCFVCLGHNHSAKYCKNTFKCHVCRKRHHTLLHPSGGSGSSSEITGAVRQGEMPTSTEKMVQGESVDKDKAAVQAEGSDKRVLSCHSMGTSGETVLIPTALVVAESRDGNHEVVRALIDQGSQGSFITEAMTQYLGLKKTSTKHLVTGVGGKKSVLSKSTVLIKLHSRVNPNFSVLVTAYVLKSITSLLPVANATRVEWEQRITNDLADPNYDRPNKIDLLLGADTYSQIISDGVERKGSLIAQYTRFGWIISGVAGRDYSSSHSLYSCITVMHTSDDDHLLRKFWELEAEPTSHKPLLTPEEIECENLYAATTRRDDSGRYIVRLPFRNGISTNEEGDYKSIAEKRLKHLELKLSKNIKLKHDYTKVIHEYLDLQHMVKVAEKEQNKGLYLPHHSVVREDKQTTKVRVVFDASCKGKNGVSLNDNLMVGPPLQADLRHTVMRWRMHPICMTADIIKMYRQVLVDRKDTKYQRILWRDDPGDKVEEFELLTVTFGTASAPYLAVRSLQQTAYDECKDNREIVAIITNDFYVDDLMTGVETVEKGVEIYKGLKEVLAKAGFQLQKWICNNKELLDKIRDDDRMDGKQVEFKMDNVTKILGLTWDSHADVFQYLVNLPLLKEPVSKRIIISDISRLFDPLGWLAPSITLAKVLIQKLWLAGISWDEPVPSILLEEWLSYRKDLPSLVNVKIPRWCNTQSSSVRVELHGFSDASKVAYAAVVYARVVGADNSVKTSILASKTRVAPIRQVSIPRLELCGAVLLAKLISEVAKVLAIDKENLYAWTDSEVVLAWLNCHPSRWKTFVANRVSEILNLIDTKHWAYVSTKENPADCASRGVAPIQLSMTPVWFNGPDFLKRFTIERKRPKHLVTKVEEVKVHVGIADDSFWYKFSSLHRLTRVVAYCRRFLNFRNKDAIKPRCSYLTNNELNEAMITCIRRCQADEFSEEIAELKELGCVSSKRKGLKSLNLFLDSDNVLRVGGRLEMSNLEFDRKHPILLPRDSFLTTLLVADAHKITMHGGPQAMVTYLRSKYWIIGVKLLAKAYFRKCVICLRHANRTHSQLMGQLPAPRATPNKPFLYTGVDYAGPINLRVSKGRGNKSYKGYISLFVCMSTRAIHLEVVSDLTSQGFLAAFKRFVARRGRCEELHSDNGSNFVGAARELQELFNEEKSSFLPEVAESLESNGVSWKFIPPHAPNFGGLWEAGVKSTKHHLRRVISNSTLTYEELSTVLAQIEACLNSRPLSYIEDESERTILTPGHFLVGEPLVLAPDRNFEKSNVSSLRRWQYTQRMVQDFWRRWSQDYLNQFLQRRRWAFKTPEPSIGDVVLVKEADLPPGKWLLGLIEQKHPGPDGITRVVTLRVKNSVIKRPTSRLCVLPVTK